MGWVRAGRAAHASGVVDVQRVLLRAHGILEDDARPVAAAHGGEEVGRLGRDEDEGGGVRGDVEVGERVVVLRRDDRPADRA
eukprot:3638234-Prymnesium_polylepis.1